MKVIPSEALVWALGFLSYTNAFPSANALERQSESAGAVEVIQAQVPPRSSYDNPSCTRTIFNHVFAASYGQPYVGEQLKGLLMIILRCTQA